MQKNFFQNVNKKKLQETYQLPQLLLKLYLHQKHFSHSALKDCEMHDRVTLLSVVLLLGEDAHTEVPVEVGLEGGGHDEVLPGGQMEAWGDLPRIDEGLGARLLRMGQEEVPVQMHVPLAMELKRSKGTSHTWQWLEPSDLT